MNCNVKSFVDIHSARQFAEIEEENRALEHAARIENDCKRKVGEATIELNERTKQQNEILKAQLAEAQKANELLVKQAADSARDAKRALIVAIISLLVAVLSLMK